MALDERLFRIDRDPDGSDTVWFVFSARSVPAGKFSMSGIMRELPGDKVFFNCLDNSWFLDVEDDTHLQRFVSSELVAGQHVAAGLLQPHPGNPRPRPSRSFGSPVLVWYGQ